MHRHNAELDLDDDNSENSPSADQLSEKIASVKKVWDKGGADMEDNPNQQSGGGSSFFGSATDAETAAIVSSAASLVSAAVLQSVHVDQTSTHGHHPSGYDGETTSSKSESGQVAVTTGSGSSSKAEGPNVAKVRPQQMLMEQQTVPSVSHIPMGGGQDDFANAAISISMGYASGTSTPLYPFTGANNASSLFSAQFAGKSDFGMQPGAQSPLSNYAPFPTPAAAPGAAAQNRSIFGQQPTAAAYVLPPVSQSLEMTPFGNQLRNTPFGAADQNLLFGAGPTATYVSQQPIRSHSAAILTNQQAPLSKPSTVGVYGNVQGSFLLQDGGVSLFSHPPPPAFGSMATQQPPNAAAMVAAARATPGASGAQQTSSPGGFDFTQPPPVSITNQPPPLAGGAILQAHILQAPPPAPQPPAPGKMASFPTMAPQQPPNFGWNAMPTHQQQQPQPKGGPQAMIQGARKGSFNPTIGPPTTQKMNVGAPGPAGILGLVQPPIMGHIFGAQQALMAQQPLSISTTSANLIGQGGNFNRRQGGAGVKGQNVSNIDQAKRDGDLLQQMDKFINSTGDEEATGGTNADLEDGPESTVAFQQVN